jgi:hypothetical protein
LGQLAATFRIELELERQFRLQGPEWTAYFRQKRQIIMDEILRVKFGEEDFTSSSGMAHDTNPTLIPPPTSVPYAGVGVHRGRSIPSPTQGHKESTSGLRPTVSAIQPEERVHPFVLPENKGTLASTSIKCDT